MQKLKKFLPLILVVIAIICSGDILLGLSQGKSIANIANIPSMLLGGGSLATLLGQWINKRYISARVIAPQIDDEFRNSLEALFTVAADLDVPDDMAQTLIPIAGAKIMAYREQAKQEKASKESGGK